MIIKRNPANLNQEFHVVVIGGGITGLAIAREAAERGLKTALIEKNDFGWATSASTSKLIHGGLRYLENLELGLVRESLKERKVLGNAAPHLIKPLPIILPIYDYSKPGKFLMRLGLWLYDILSFERNFFTPRDKYMPSSQWLGRKKVMEILPCLKEEGLKGGFLYYDHQSLHPERLSLAFLKTAVSSGAAAFNHMSVDSFATVNEGNKQRITAIHTTDTLNGKKYNIKGKIFINCTGPWLDYTLEKVIEKPAVKLQRSQGIHILSQNICGKVAVLHRNKEGRHFFILPWMGLSLTGPTDSPFTDHPDSLFPQYRDTFDLINTVNKSLNAPITASKIKNVIIGLRPLISSGSSTYRTSRKSEIYNHEFDGIRGLFSVAGGKLTTSRFLGEKTIKLILKTKEMKGVSVQKQNSENTPLFGSISYGHSETEYEKKALMDYAIRELNPEIHQHLIRLYGTEHREILHMIKTKPELAARIDENSIMPDILAQIDYAVLNESARTLEDVLNRRLAIGTTGYPGDAVVKKVALVMAKLLKWNSTVTRREITTYKGNYPSLDNIKKKN